MDNPTQKYLYQQFVAWSCNGCSSAPLTDFINNPVYQELINENDYNGLWCDERVIFRPESKCRLYIWGGEIRKKWFQDKPSHPT